MSDVANAGVVIGWMADGLAAVTPEDVAGGSAVLVSASAGGAVADADDAAFVVIVLAVGGYSAEVAHDTVSAE